MTIAILGFGVQFQIGDGASPEVFATLEELVDASPPGVSRAPVDGTHMGAEARFMLFLSGLRDGGEIPLVFHYSAETYDVLLEEYLEDAIRRYRVVGPDGYYWEFQGFVTVLEAPPPIDDVWEINVNIKVSGKPTYVAPPVPPTPPFEADITVFFKAGQSDSLGADSRPSPVRTPNNFATRLDTIKPAVYSGSFGTTFSQAVETEYVFGTINHQGDVFALSIMDNLDTFITARTGLTQAEHGKQVIVVDTGLSGSDVSGFAYPTAHFQKVLDWCDAAVAAAALAGKSIKFEGIIWAWGAYAYANNVSQATAKASIESYCGAAGSVATYVLPKFGQTGQSFPVMIMSTHHHYQAANPEQIRVALAERELADGEPSRYRIIHGKGIHHFNGLNLGWGGGGSHHHPNEEELMGGVVAWYIDDTIVQGGTTTWPTLIPTVAKTSARRFTLTFSNFPEGAAFGFKSSGLSPTIAQPNHGWLVCDQATPTTGVALVRPPYAGAVAGTLIIDTVADIPTNWEIRYGSITTASNIAGNTVIRYANPRTVPVKGVATELFHALPALKIQGS